MKPQIRKQDGWVRISVGDKVDTLNILEAKHLLLDLENAIETLEIEERARVEQSIQWIKQRGEQK